MVIKVSECYECVHGVVCSSAYRTLGWTGLLPKLYTASRNALISSLHHTMQVKVVMDCAQYLFEP
jgi:hypothetical protein